MRERLEQRLRQLTSEFESGQKVLADLEAQQATVRDTLLRISGAITVLKEELEAADQNGQEAPLTLDTTIPTADRG